MQHRRGAMWVLVRLSREDLHRLVWSEPMYVTAVRVGISGWAFADHCRRLAVPTPPNAWRRRSKRRRFARPPLPKNARVRQDLEYLEWRGTGPAPDAPLYQRLMGPVEQPVAVPKAIRDPHPLIQESIDLLRTHGLDVWKLR